MSLNTAAGPAAVGATGVGAASSKPADAACVLELPEDVDFQLGQLKHLLAELQKALQAASAAVPSAADLAAIPEPLERARLCMCIAKAVNSLHHVYVRAHGRDPFAPSTAGGVSVGRQELDRIRQYDKKVARAVQDSSRPILSLDVAAASRFIDAAIPDLSEQQRRDLKRAAQAADARRGDADRRKGKKPRQQQQQQQQQHRKPEAQERAIEPEEDTDGEEEEEDEEDVAGRGADAKVEAAGAGETDKGATAVAADPGSGGAKEAAEQFLAALAGSGGAWGT